MDFMYKEIQDAFYASPLPSELSDADKNDYFFIMEQLGKDLYKLYKNLNREHMRLVENCFMTMSLQLDFMCSHYFQYGWLAAKEDNKLDHY